MITLAFCVADTVANVYALQARVSSQCLSEHWLLLNLWKSDYICLLCCWYFSTCLCNTGQGELRVSVRRLVASESTITLAFLLWLFFAAFVVVVDTLACACAVQARLSSESQAGHWLLPILWLLVLFCYCCWCCCCFGCCWYFSMCLCRTSQGELKVSVRRLVASESDYPCFLLLLVIFFKLIACFYFNFCCTLKLHHWGLCVCVCKCVCVCAFLLTLSFPLYSMGVAMNPLMLLIIDLFCLSLPSVWGLRWILLCCYLLTYFSLTFPSVWRLQWIHLCCY